MNSLCTKHLLKEGKVSNGKITNNKRKNMTSNNPKMNKMNRTNYSEFNSEFRSLSHESSLFVKKQVCKGPNHSYLVRFGQNYRSL